MWILILGALGSHRGSQQGQQGHFPAAALWTLLLMSPNLSRTLQSYNYSDHTDPAPG